MSAALGYMQLCRLCLIKDKVNVPIFGDPNDGRQIFLKISACLPVKVSRDDHLPKNICDTCLYKVDLLYQFWNTTVNAEKQLLQWLGDIGLDANLKTSDSQMHMLGQSHAHPHSMGMETMVFKEERHDPEIRAIEQNMQGYGQNQNLYSEYNLHYQQQMDASSMENTSYGNEKTPVTDQKPEITEPPPAKKTRGRPTRTAKKRAAEVIAAVANSSAPDGASDESMDESSNDRLGMQNDSDDDDIDATEDTITKEEAELDEEYVDNPEPLEPTTFVGVPSTSTCDTEQPGPSGINKPATTTTNTDPGLEDPLTFHWNIPSSVHTPSNKSESSQYQHLENKDSDTQYVCNVCQKSLNNRAQYLKHIKRHDEKKHTCDICGKKFVFPYELKLHKEFHRTDCTFECEACNRKFKSAITLKMHRRRHEGDYAHVCEECGRGFVYNSEYKYHMNAIHKGKRYYCDHCDRSFSDKFYYRKHLLIHDPDEKVDNFESVHYKCSQCNKTFSSEAKLEQHKDRHKNSFICQLCGCSLSSSYSLKCHMCTHTDDNPFICDLCGKAFSNQAVLIAHKRTHSNEKPYTCEECNKQFSQKGALASHKRLHSEEQPFPCNICDMKFITKSARKYHRRMKHGRAVQDRMSAATKVKLEYKCNVCDSVFTSKSGLHHHISRHNNVCYTCDVCGKSLTTKSSLKDHKLIHTGDKPFSCTLCEKSFNKQALLNVHKRIHTGLRPYTCEYCYKSFTQQSSLKVHLRYHNNERPYSCEFCQEKFVTRTIMNTHVKSKHDSVN